MDFKVITYAYNIITTQYDLIKIKTNYTFQDFWKFRSRLVRGLKMHL